MDYIKETESSNKKYLEVRSSKLLTADQMEKYTNLGYTPTGMLPIVTTREVRCEGASILDPHYHYCYYFSR